MTIHRDYIQRIIEEFGQGLARMLSKRDESTYEQMQMRIELACRANTGIDYVLVKEIPHEKLFGVLRMGATVRPYRYRMLGDLLALDGYLLREEARIEEAQQREALALRMFLTEIADSGDESLEDCLAAIEDLIQTTPHRDLPRDLQIELFEHFERHKRFALGEKILYDLTDANDPEMRQRAWDFYHRLLGYEDEDLLAGGLTREEVVRGIARLG